MYRPISSNFKQERSSDLNLDLRAGEISPRLLISSIGHSEIIQKSCQFSLFYSRRYDLKRDFPRLSLFSNCKRVRDTEASLC